MPVKTKKSTSKAKTSKKSPSRLDKVIKKLNLARPRNQFIVAFLVVGLLGGGYFAYSSFASTDNPYSNVFADVYGEGKSKGIDAEAELVGRLYKDGTLICSANPGRSEAEFQKYKTVVLSKKEKAQINKAVNQGELDASPGLEAENFNKLTADAPRVTIRKNGKSATHNISKNGKPGTKKVKALDVDKLVRVNCNKPGHDFIPDVITFGVTKINKPVAKTVSWPNNLPVLKTDEQILSDNIKNSMGSAEKTNTATKDFLINNGLYSEDELMTYSEKTINSAQSKQLYAFAVANQSKSKIYVSSTGSTYEIQIGIEPPTNTESTPESQPTNKPVGLNDKIFPKANAGEQAPPPVRNLRIKVLVTDENRKSLPSLSRYYSVAQLNQLYWPGQANGRNVNISEVSYHFTPAGTKITAFCGAAGIVNCNTNTALNTAAANADINRANNYTALVIPGIIGSDACGRGYVPGSVAVTMDRVVDNGCGSTSINNRARTIAHEFMHNLGFDHEAGTTTLMSSPCLNRDIFACPLSNNHRWTLNVNGTFNVALRVKLFLHIIAQYTSE